MFSSSNEMRNKKISYNLHFCFLICIAITIIARLKVKCKVCCGIPHQIFTSLQFHKYMFQLFDVYGHSRSVPEPKENKTTFH